MHCLYPHSTIYRLRSLRRYFPQLLRLWLSIYRLRSSYMRLLRLLTMFRPDIGS